MTNTNLFEKKETFFLFFSFAAGEPCTFHFVNKQDFLLLFQEQNPPFSKNDENYSFSFLDENIFLFKKKKIKKKPTFHWRQKDNHVPFFEKKKVLSFSLWIWRNCVLFSWKQFFMWRNCQFKSEKGRFSRKSCLTSDTRTRILETQIRLKISKLVKYSSNPLADGIFIHPRTR